MNVDTKTGLVSGCNDKFRARAKGGALDPSLIIVHDTAGHLKHGSSRDYFASKDCKVSAHFVVETDGTIYQMVPTNIRAFHAGASVWDGKKFCNSYALGIEIVSPGKLTASGKAWFGQAADPGAIQRVDSKPHGGVGYWLPYTTAQIEAVKKLCRALVVAYPRCNEIVGHFDVSPGRKIDPSPLFPFAEVREYADGLDSDPADADPGDEFEPPVTLDTLADESRKAALVKHGGRVIGGITAGGAALQVTQELSHTLQATRGVNEGVSTVTETVRGVGGLAKAVDQNGLAVLCVLGVVVLVGLFFLGRWMIQDVREGRAVPSGRK